jgi:hypothetical protein
LKNHDDDAKPTARSQQMGLFGNVVVTANQQRRNPHCALLRFPIRKDWDDGDVPLELPVQLGLDDASVDRVSLAREATDGLPISDRECVRRELGSDASGHARARFKAERDKIVLALFHRLKRTEGYEAAVCSLFSVIAQDPTYMRDDPPTWLIELFAQERALLMATFTRDGDRRVELGDSPDEDDEEESEAEG